MIIGLSLVLSSPTRERPRCRQHLTGPRQGEWFAALETEVYRVRNQRRGAARPAADLHTTTSPKTKKESA